MTKETTTTSNAIPHFRIITHAGCTDGFFSAWITKRYFNELTGLNLTREEITKIPVIGHKPAEVQTGEIELTEHDILLDLPLPENTKVFLWVDHHSSAKPKRDLDQHEHWEQLPSCTGQLIAMIEKNGLTLSKELKNFKIAMDKIDSADYTEAEIMQAYYHPKEGTEFDTKNPLITTHILASFIHTKDLFLNTVLLANLTNCSPKADSPLTDPSLWAVKPTLFYQSQLNGYQEWRDQVDTYIEYNKEFKTIIQDTRKIHRSFGIVDRFYAYIKFPEASYGIVIKERNETLAYLGVGCNIFHKERCKVDIGRLCKNIATKFGTGGGGGHKTVGGCVIRKEHVDEAKKIILNTFESAE
tara:strand:- start:1198 stop:2265 length:1068 start_codon:yes stop_codon:yes gene_type:complete